MGGIVIDPGHGGSDPGAIGPSGLREKTVNLEVALALRCLLEPTGTRPAMTREGDGAVSLERRVAIANYSGARIFVSLHCNYATSPSARGVETYFYPGSREGESLARHVQAELVALGGADRGVKRARFYVIHRTVMPAVLTEMGFLTNPEEERLLGDPGYRSLLATALFRAIRAYLGGAR